MDSLRIIAVLLVARAALYAGAAKSTPLTVEQENVLHSVRDYAMSYTKNLPDFLCTQITNREVTTPAGAFSTDQGFYGNKFGPSDQLVEKVTYFDQKENYEVISINGKKATGVEHIQLAGAISTGEFGSALHDIFNPHSHAVFASSKMVRQNGRSLYVFAFHVPPETGTPVFDRIAKQHINAGYSGFLFVDADTKEVVRITSRLEFPHGFPIEAADRMVEYKPTTIAGRTYNLPSHSEVHMQRGPELYVNKIEFKDYRKFAVESTIRFGSLDQALPEPNPAVTSAAASATDQAADPLAAKAQDNPGATARQSPPPPIENPIAAPIASSEATPTPSADTSTPAPAAQNSSAAQGQAAATSEQATSIAAATQPLPLPASNAGAQPVDASSFRLHISADLVLVPVVVRDGNGRALGNLTKDDFEIFDKGKRQQIANFTVETLAGPATEDDGAPSPAGGAGPNAPAPKDSVTHLIVYLFDDLHLKFADLARVRDAALRHMDSLPDTAQAAILTTSGLVQVPFSHDRARWHDALLKLRAQPVGGSSGKTCPDVSYYMADLMLNRYNPSSATTNPPLQAAIAETMGCMSPIPETAATHRALESAKEALAQGERQSRGALFALRDVVGWLSKMPGGKTVILVSPGFVLGNSARFDETGLIDQAIRAQVIINALDARGLEALNPAGEIEDNSVDPAAMRIKSALARDEATAVTGVMEEMAAGTGGTFVQNTNDLDSGFRRLASPPEYRYLLGFKPEGIKLDGSFHPLKIKLNSREKLNMQARLGYFAPKQ